MENIGNFIKAIQVYGMKPHDIFEANDLFENGNMTQVQTTLVALAGLVSICTPGVGPNPCASYMPYKPCKYKKHPACQERAHGTESLRYCRGCTAEGCVLPHAPGKGLEFRLRVPDCFPVHTHNRGGSQESTDPCRISFWLG